MQRNDSLNENEHNTTTQKYEHVIVVCAAQNPNTKQITSSNN